MVNVCVCYKFWHFFQRPACCCLACPAPVNIKLTSHFSSDRSVTFSHMHILLYSMCSDYQSCLFCLLVYMTIFHYIHNKEYFSHHVFLLNGNNNVLAFTDFYVCMVPLKDIPRTGFPFMLHSNTAAVLSFFFCAT